MQNYLWLIAKVLPFILILMLLTFGEDARAGTAIEIWVRFPEWVHLGFIIALALGGPILVWWDYD